MPTYAIGDIQGCYEELRCLLDQMQFDPAHDMLWLTGDLVNRGPKSLEVLRFARSLGTSAQIILGNHDLHLLAAAYGIRKTKSKDTLGAILDAPDRAELVHWLRQQPLLHSDRSLGFSMVHAGIPHLWSLAQAHALAAEVEQALQSDQVESFLSSMYGNDPLAWDNSLTAPDRLRTITNYFTRMRFCNADGELDLVDTGSKVSDRPGFRPWFEHPNPALEGQRIVFGHWAALEGETNSPRFQALDTGCAWGAQLTGLRLDDGVRFSCSCAHLGHPGTPAAAS